MLEEELMMLEKAFGLAEASPAKALAPKARCAHAATTAKPAIPRRRRQSEARQAAFFS